MTYGAMLAHVLVRALRIQAALDNEIPLEQLRPIACLHVARAFARDVIDALAAPTRCAWVRLSQNVGRALALLARELKPSTSRPRIALKLGTVGAQEIGHGLSPERMKDAWCLATSPADLGAAAVVKLYGRRFTIEETFRGTKDVHFGMGLSAT